MVSVFSSYKSLFSLYDSFGNVMCHISDLDLKINKARHFRISFNIGGIFNLVS